MERERSAYWDNLKAVLIFLVVLGHYYGYGYVYQERSGGLWDIPNAVYGFIYMFHMPLFAFISGHFSRNVERTGRGAAEKLLLPYLLFNTLFLGLDWLLFRKPIYNPLFYPYNHMWYLLALFFWRVTARYIVRIKHYCLLSLTFAVLCAMFPPAMDMPCISRAILFWPFFLIGIRLGDASLIKLRRFPKVLSAFFLALGYAAALFLIHYRGWTTYQTCFLPRSFAHNLSGLPDLGKMLLRYVGAGILGVSFMAIIPRRKCFLSAIGQNTMGLFLLHSLPGLRNWMVYLCPVSESLGGSMLYYFLCACLITILLGNSRVTRLYQRVMSWVAEHIRRLFVTQ